MKNSITINNKIINWILDEFASEKLNDNYCQILISWKNKKTQPTISKIREISKKINIPFGYFFLSKKPKETIDFLQYRTVKSKVVSKPSRELIDTIYAMDDIQTWMSNYKKDNGLDRNNFVGNNKEEIIKRNYINIANSIRKELKINDNWYELISSDNAYKYFVSKIQKAGIIVMSNGLVGNNPYRQLNVEEFRAFAIVDDYAPLIFINSADTSYAKLFSLLHELTHIWLGASDLITSELGFEDKDDIEQVCNGVAAEILVPIDSFKKSWGNYHIDTYDKIAIFSREYKCSKIVIARRALDLGYISQEIYNQVAKEVRDIFFINKQKHRGGNFYDTHYSRYDINFVKAIYESVNIGTITYTEAYRLTNTNSKTFKRAIEDRVETYVE